MGLFQAKLYFYDGANSLSNSWSKESVRKLKKVLISKFALSTLRASFLEALQTVCAFFFSHCNLRRNLEKKKLFLFKKKSRELLYCSSSRRSSSLTTRFRKQLKQVESYCMQASFKPPFYTIR